jgi:hypothetical protein
MSLDRLPTELDSKIAGYLVDDKKSLSALSMTSKYYRSLTEPHLYQNLSFDSNDWEALTLLMLTLVHGERLALHIKSLEIGHYHRRLYESCADRVFKAAVGARLWAESAGVYNKIKELIQAALRIEVNACYVLIPLHSKLFSDYSLYPPLALMLCLAENISALSVCEQAQGQPRLSIWRFISLPWAQFKPKALGSLEYLSICGYYEDGIFGPGPGILPPMTTLKISKCSSSNGGVDDTFPNRLFTLPVAILSPQIKRVQKLILTEVLVTPRSIMIFIGCPWFANLKQLRVSKCQPYKDDHHNSWDMQDLVGALEQHTPNLEVFEWTGGKYIHPPPVFGTFLNL